MAVFENRRKRREEMKARKEEEHLDNILSHLVRTYAPELGAAETNNAIQDNAKETE